MRINNQRIHKLTFKLVLLSVLFLTCHGVINLVISYTITSVAIVSKLEEEQKNESSKEEKLEKDSLEWYTFEHATLIKEKSVLISFEKQQNYHSFSFFEIQTPPPELIGVLI